MRFKKVLKALVCPPMAIMLILTPVATVFLVYSMVFLGSTSVIAVASYALSAYTLTVWCFKIPYMIRFFKKFKAENKYFRIWREDVALKMNISLYGTLIWNTAYSMLQLGMGFWHRSFWFFSLAAYYISLAVMRYFLLRHTRRFDRGVEMLTELIRYRNSGVILLVMNLALSLMVFFMVYWNRSFVHHEITTICMALYTFVSLTKAIINTVNYRKYNSPVYSAAKAISLAAACVSLLILESTMLTTFGGETMDITARRIMLGVSGGAVSVFIVIMAVYMIVNGTKRINLEKAKEK